VFDPGHEFYIRRCIELARRAQATGDVPVGAVVVCNGNIVGEGVEGVKAARDVTAHAEIEALRAAGARLDRLDLTGCTLYTSVAPCVMCAYAIRLARISTVIIGAKSSDAGWIVNGSTVLSNREMLPDRPVPTVIDVIISSR
jgi:tRNA(adenine34) deaminase